jgi:hypothetical protein
VVSDDHSGSKGYGFVHFETREAAEKATAKVNGMMLNNSKVRYCSFTLLCCCFSVLNLFV